MALRSLLIATMLAVGVAHAEPARHMDLEMMYTEARFDEGLRTARARLAEHPDDAELYWQIARFMYEIGEKVQKHEATFDKEAWYAEMLEMCDKGLALSPDHPHLLFGRGIAMGRLGTTRGVLSSLRMADDIERDWLVAAEADFEYRSPGGEEILPCDAYMGLGSFYRMVPDWWIVQVLSGTRGDLDASLEWLKKSNQCAPGRIETQKEIGVTLICMGQKRDQDALVIQGTRLLDKVAAMPPTKPTDRIDVVHAAMVRDEPSMACEYSRDGQMDLDPDKLPAVDRKAAASGG